MAGFSRRRAFILGLVAVVGLWFLIPAMCSGPKTPEEKVRAAIGAVADGVGKPDLSAALAPVSKRYLDEDGADFAMVRGILFGELQTRGRITVHRKPAAESLDPRTGRTRTIPERWHVGMASGPLTKDVIAGRGVSETRSTGRVLGLIARVLLDGGTLEMPGVGTFELVHKEGYQGRARGRVVTRPPRTVLMFRLDDGLRADMESRRR